MTYNNHQYRGSLLNLKIQIVITSKNKANKKLILSFLRLSYLLDTFKKTTYILLKLESKYDTYI